MSGIDLVLIGIPMVVAIFTAWALERARTSVVFERGMRLKAEEDAARASLQLSLEVVRRRELEAEAHRLRGTFSALASMTRPGRMEFLAAVVDERNRQDAKWGAEDHWTEEKFARVLGEEFGEVCRAINDDDPKNLESEVVQVAAVCLKWHELGRRR